MFPFAHSSFFKMAAETTDEEKKLSCLIADSAAFLRNVGLQNLAERIFTIREVITEIRDSATRKRLAVLPYEVEFREPSVDSINTGKNSIHYFNIININKPFSQIQMMFFNLFLVTEFSKKTGDYKSLSAVDIRVLALSYQLEKEFGSPKNIKLEPKKEVT